MFSSSGPQCFGNSYQRTYMLLHCVYGACVCSTLNSWHELSSNVSVGAQQPCAAALCIILPSSLSVAACWAYLRLPLVLGRHISCHSSISVESWDSVSLCYWVCRLWPTASPVLWHTASLISDIQLPPGDTCLSSRGRPPFFFPLSSSSSSLIRRARPNS